MDVLHCLCVVDLSELLKNLLGGGGNSGILIIGILFLLLTGNKDGTFWELLKKILPQVIRDKQHRKRIESEWSSLIEDSREREDAEAVDLLNSWMERRNTQGLPRENPNKLSGS